MDRLRADTPLSVFESASCSVLDPHDFGEDFLPWNAERIQRWYRARVVRRKFLLMRWAVKVIQRAWRTRGRGRECSKEGLDLSTPAVKIQRAWRCFWSRRIYKYYRDLIRFREKGDPALLLKSINPKEAQFAEAAAGLHIRFRLGGSTFPPMVFYKVYTHRPVTDICSFCPRDYAALSKSRAAQKAAPKHTKAAPVHPALVDEGEWYLRWENNGWRPVADRLLQPIDPVTLRTGAQRRPFHYMRAKRKEEVEKAARQKKLDWLRRMYKEGKENHTGSVGGSESEPAKKGREQSLLEQWDKVGVAPRGERAPPPGGGGEPEEEELLNWSSGLDFEAYQRGWFTLATSSTTDNMIDLDALYKMEVLEARAQQVGSGPLLLG